MLDRENRSREFELIVKRQELEHAVDLEAKRLLQARKLGEKRLLQTRKHGEKRLLQTRELGEKRLLQERGLEARKTEVRAEYCQSFKSKSAGYYFGFKGQSQSEVGYPG